MLASGSTMAVTSRGGARRGAVESDSHKGYTKGTHRTVSPAATIARVAPFMAEMGITRVANVTGLDRISVPVVMVVRPNSRSVAVSQGKGLDLEAAKASGLMESVESWHAERIAHPVKYGTHQALARDHRMVEIERLPEIRRSRFHAQKRLLWIEGVNLLDGQSLWLPYEMVHTDYTHPSAPGHGCFPASTNGLASGNHPLEATCHAICEVIERDATSVWHALPARRRAETRIKPDSIADPACRSVLERFEAAGLEIAIWDVTSDVGVPCFYCLLLEGAGSPGHLGAGAGCHPASEIALLRALTEAAQTRLTYVSGSRDDLSPTEFTDQGVNDKHQAARALIGNQDPQRAFDSSAAHGGDSFQEDLDWILGRLQAVGISEVLQVDLTRPDIGIPVIRVVIPGLEAPHDDDTYVPGPRAQVAAEAEA